MNNVNSFLSFSIEKNEAEIRDLKRFWDDLSWWERDESMNAALNFSTVDHRLLAQRPDDLKQRSDKILEEIKMLDILNAKARPSKLRLMLRLVPYEGQKPNFRICLSKIWALSIDDLVNLGKYLGIEKVESLREHPNDLYKLYWDIGANRTLAIFFAFRNYLGKLNI
ncbi:hypothetical protein ANME2D_00688 [Candidatus Methanoperedens nitroreducens]|uniref:Uncharacterized protein n=1 Tax=Candidatus Methanoperedens nitratireducens TaxID=1392998 RepID=A0A062V8J6_9EURY|nr:hypothetical protein [Candidatus Methanoperedens nitroreducens]KCZ73617.1 hypothetical protein ANME2D_00688 [Candidatus Methanoperedens nitroreducens]MDJ1422423.1 hypothetical protein [Candidatus Methanoperedens sp.]